MKKDSKSINVYWAPHSVPQDGGSIEKPVGTVWIAVAGPDGCRAERFQMGKDRGRNIQKSVQAALNMLRQRVVGASQ